MAHYTVLDESSIESILKPYGRSQNGTFKVLSGGSENTNYFVPTVQGDIVLTICEQKTTKAANELASLLDYLQENNFATSKLIKTIEGKLTIEFQAKPVMVKEFIPGEVIKNIPEHLLVKLGQDLAKLHQISAPAGLQTEISYGIQNFHQVETYDDGSEFHQWILEIKDYVNQHISIELPKALIHSDIFYNNIIVSKDRQNALIMDFEEASYYYRVFDIGMMLIGVCSDDNGLIEPQARALLQGYQKELDLKTQEIIALQAFTVYAAASTGFWRHQNFNHVKPDPKMFSHYKAMQRLARQVRSIDEGNFLDLLNNKI